MSEILKSRRMTLAFMCVILYVGYDLTCRIMELPPGETILITLNTIMMICLGSKVQQSNGTYT